MTKPKKISLVGRPKESKPTGTKPPADRLSQRVCAECERDVLVGWSAGIQVRLEPELTTTAAEGPLWALGQPTYAVVRDGAKVTLTLRIPSPSAPAVDEIAVAHICRTSERWMGWVQECPEWFGLSEYVVAYIPDRGYVVLKADAITHTYKELVLCMTQEMAHRDVQSLRWRARARELR